MIGSAFADNRGHENGVCGFGPAGGRMLQITTVTNGFSCDVFIYILV